MESLLKVYRLSKAIHAEDLSGTGSYLGGGRWNSKGYHAIYTGSSISLCILEILAHIPAISWPSQIQLVTIQIPTSSIESINLLDLNEEWKTKPFSFYSQNIGNQWINENRSLILEVPSAINPYESNFIINPNHPEMEKVKIYSNTPFLLDKRLKT